MNYQGPISTNEPSVILPGYVANSRPSHEHFINRLLRTNQGSNSHSNQNYKMFAASIKVVISSIVLLFTDTVCSQPLDKWLSMMIVYDLLVIAAQYLTKLGPQSSSNNNNSSQPGYLLSNSDSRNVRDAVIDEESGINLQGSLPDISTDSSSYFRETCRVILLARIQSFAIMYYVLIFIYGQLIYYNPDSDCSNMAPILTWVVGLFIFFQYLTFIIPFIAISCYIIALLIIINRFPSLLASNQVPANNEAINNLPSTKFSQDLPGDHECRICMCDYEEGDDIIQLQCSNLHHFHAECIKKWLKVNGVCPICRKKLNEMNT